MACKIDLTLNNGTKMPALGIGTWQAPDDEVEAALDKALEAGYRHIDCAPVYRNEKAVGRVLKKWLDSGKVTRDELFIVTKLPPMGECYFGDLPLLTYNRFLFFVLFFSCFISQQIVQVPLKNILKVH